ncbi:MAG: glycosyltransferase [Oscillospiraceae bacterium]
MLTDKEKNFVSAVVYLENNETSVVPFLKMLNATLSSHFDKYEIIFVNDASSDGSKNAVKNTATEITAPVTLVNMSIRQGVEMCMNSGLDAAIGDFVFEFDTLEILYDEATIFAAYKKSLEGFDIVTVGPVRATKLSSRLFYAIFNRYANNNFKLQTDVFHLISRRAINRLHSINKSLPYRKAAYAASGLKMAHIDCNAPAKSANKGIRTTNALDALALYTNAAYRLSLGISLVMLGFTIFTVGYTIFNFIFNANTIQGWTTTMLVLSAGFFGVFLILAIVIKYLSLLVELIFKNQKYLVESIEKL